MAFSPIPPPRNSAHLPRAWHRRVLRLRPPRHCQRVSESARGRGSRTHRRFSPFRNHAGCHTTPPRMTMPRHIERPHHAHADPARPTRSGFVMSVLCEALETPPAARPPTASVASHLPARSDARARTSTQTHSRTARMRQREVPILPRQAALDKPDAVPRVEPGVECTQARGHRIGFTSSPTNPRVTQSTPARRVRSVASITRARNHTPPARRPA